MLLGDRRIARAPEGLDAGREDREVDRGVDRPAEVHGVEQRLLLELAQHRHEHAVVLGVDRTRGGWDRIDDPQRQGLEHAGAADGEGPVGIVIVVGRQGELLEVVGALGPPRGLAHAWTAGSNREISTAMIAITTSNSISVKPRRGRGAHERAFMALASEMVEDGNDDVSQATCILTWRQNLARASGP